MAKWWQFGAKMNWPKLWMPARGNSDFMWKKIRRIIVMKSAKGEWSSLELTLDILHQYSFKRQLKGSKCLGMESSPKYLVYFNIKKLLNLFSESHTTPQLHFIVRSFNDGIWSDDIYISTFRAAFTESFKVWIYLQIYHLFSWILS